MDEWVLAPQGAQTDNAHTNAVTPSWSLVAASDDYESDFYATNCLAMSLLAQ
jgi:hypothetical protein